MATLHIPGRQLPKRKSWSIIGLFVFLWNFDKRCRTVSTVILQDSTITQVSLHTPLYCWVYQMLHEDSFQIINMYSISCQTRASELLWPSYSRGEVNQMWILKNSKDMLEYIQSRSLSSWNIIKTFDFSTLYTTIPHSKLKDRLREFVHLCFTKKNDQCRYKYIVLGRDKSYFVKKNNTLILPKSVLKLISSICLIDNINYVLCLMDAVCNRQ